jgi:hypothetical protein
MNEINSELYLWYLNEIQLLNENNNNNFKKHISK